MNTGLDIQEIKGIIKRRRSVFVISSLIIFTIGVIIALILPPTYTSEAMIRVEDQQITGEFDSIDNYRLCGRTH